jgi:hypothetical protein
MNKITRVMLALLTAVGLTACSEANSPLGPQQQLVDGTLRLTGTEEGAVLAFATFTIATTGGTTTRAVGSPGINEEGREIGSCGEGGRWKNPAGRWAGAIPHAHCVVVAEASLIRLEVVNARRWQHNRNVYRMAFSNEEEASLYVQYQSAAGKTQAAGVMEAIALKDGVAYGKFVIDLGQYGAEGVNLLNGTCYLGDAETEAAQVADTENWRQCLDRVISADFFADVNANPLTATPTNVVTGWIYWQ